MKRVLSTVVTALVAVSFAGMVWAADRTGTDTVIPPAGEGTGMSTGGQSDQGSAGMSRTKKTRKKRKKTRKSRKSTRRTTGSRVTGTQPNYGTPATGGPSGNIGIVGSDTGRGGGTGTDGTGR